MARHMIQANKEVFKRLIDKFKEFPELTTGDINTSDHVPRWISTNVDEKELLKHSTIQEKTLCLTDKYIFKINYKYEVEPFTQAQELQLIPVDAQVTIVQEEATRMQEEKEEQERAGEEYVHVTTGERFFIVLPEAQKFTEPFMRGAVNQINENAGLLTLVWGEGAYPLSELKDYGNQLIETVFGRDKAYEHKDLSDFFAPCDIWEVEEELYNKPPYAIYGGRLTQVDEKLNLDFLIVTKIKIRKMFEDDTGNIISEALFRGLTSTHWSHSFLEFYRCIERLYHIPYLKQLGTSLDSIKSTSDIASIIEDSLGWKPKEEEALIKLIQSLDSSFIGYIKQELNIFDPTVIISPDQTERLLKQKETNRAKLQDLLVDFNIIHTEGRTILENTRGFVIEKQELLVLSFSKYSNIIQSTVNEVINALDLYIIDTNNVDSENIKIKLIDDLSEFFYQQDQMNIQEKLKYDALIKIVARDLYKTRNNIAHWRPIGDNNKPIADWQKLIDVTIDIIDELYKEFRDDF
ncbi:hypothetical protein [Paenibacillus agricola]|uniref:Apea-like HEPN domain-containing protein n=1 Tax=Paenibacillus agricola TaxID=2716264 RepID=A0ABX0J662_9BACL|nr:hypothetical protein [Paenibacillus agricola]NHN31622.1 hypothetical protein [Paenibacillus agricola]